MWGSPQKWKAPEAQTRISINILEILTCQLDDFKSSPVLYKFTFKIEFSSLIYLADNPV